MLTMARDTIEMQQKYGNYGETTNYCNSPHLKKKKLAKEFFKLYFINSVYSPKVLHFVKEISVIDDLPHKFCGTYIYCD